MVRTTKDGRTIRTGSHYTDFRRTLWTWQAGMCGCGRSTQLDADWDVDWAFHVHHKNGRGMGGGKRDDTTIACIGLCGKCHRMAHNQ